MAGFALVDPLAVVAEVVAVVLLLSVLLLEELVEVEVASDEEVESVDEAAVDPSDDPVDELSPEPPPLLPLSNVNVHCLTSRTCDSPSIGVKVIVHVSVARPIGL